MDLGPYVEDIQRQLAVAAEAGGDDARALAERLVAPLDAAVRLTLQDVLTAAAEQITCDLAPGSVEVRLRGREPELVVTLPPVDLPADDPPAAGPPLISDGEDGAVARVNLRLPDQLKGRVEQAAAAEGLSVNTWLVRAAAAALERSEPGPRRDRRPGQGTQRFTGWVR
jgi:hypothetical protein